MKRDSHLTQLDRELEKLSRSLARVRRQLSSAQPGSSARAARANQLAAYLALAPALAEDELLANLLRCAMHVVRGGGAGLTLFDRRKQRLVFRAALGDGAKGIIGQPVPLRGSLHGLAFATGEVQSATPLHRKIEKAAGAKFRNVLVAPLVVEGNSVGTISAVNKLGANHFDAEDMAAFKLFADVAATIVEQRSREELLRKGISASGQERLPISCNAEDRELLALFDAVQHLKRSRPQFLPALRRLVEDLAR